MSELPALLAVYSDIKVVKTRGAVQIIFEMPLSEMKRAVDLLGAPLADQSVWVGIARVDPNKVPQPEAPVQIEHANDEGEYEDEPLKPPRPLSQIAAMLCGIGAFQQFICEESDGWDHRPNTDEAAEWLRSNCGIKSRTELNTNEVAAQRFKKIRSQYEAWRLVG
jgi:hypothetical protein